MRKLCLIICLFFTSGTGIYAQNDSLNALKYEHYRQRLVYFVKPGFEQGNSQIAGIRNRWDYGYSDLNFGQHGIYMGYYLAMLASEYKVLMLEEKSAMARKTQIEIKQALYQYINYLDKSHSRTIVQKDSFDGFFVRENVPCNFLYQKNNFEYFNQGLTHNDRINLQTGRFGNLPPGHPGWVDQISECDSIPNVMSQDEVIGVLMGLAMVYKCLPENSEEHLIAKEIALKMIQYVRNSSRKHGHALSMRWRIFSPKGQKLRLSQGGVAWFFAQGFVKSARFFGDTTDNFLRKLSRYPQDLFFQFGQFMPSPNPDNIHMMTTLAAIGDVWRVPIPVVGCILKIPATRFGINRKTSTHDWEGFYQLYYNQLHDRTLRKKSILKLIETQLNQAPMEGPYNYGHGFNPKGSGWSASYKFHLKKSIQQGEKDGIPGNYNGVDYLLYYNLYKLELYREKRD